MLLERFRRVSLSVNVASSDVCVTVACWGVMWRGVAWCGVVWRGVMWCGVVWCGVAWCEVEWSGVARCGVVLVLLVS